MSICITGMHRSGTSMVAHLLHQSGLYLGNEADLVPPTPDNAEGHWENIRFKEINERILEQQHSTWFSPARMDHEWSAMQSLKISEQARALLDGFNGHEPWGWKDPRNCLTLPAWNNLLPDLKVVICLRNPLEVARSLQRRPVFKYSPGSKLWKAYKEMRSALSINRRRFFSKAGCLTLWQTYNENILRHTTTENRIVTHYEAYLSEPGTELRRVLTFLKMGVSEDTISRATSIASDKLRHNRFSKEHLLDDSVPETVRDLYFRMCAEADFRIG